MAKIADIKRRGRSWLTYLLLVVLGVLVGRLIPSGTAVPRTLSGTVTAARPLAGGAGTVFEFTPSRGPRQTYLLLAPTPWRSSAAGTWHRSGQPACLVPRSAAPRRVKLAVVTVRASGPAAGGMLVIWLQCQG
ncbi:MAG: hypothetical protein ACYCO9_11995 [Streptosporangiaceae bacterium]